MRVVVVGLGYVGSVCSACLASRGHEVVGVDTSEFKVGCVDRGESPIVETGLAELIADARKNGRLSATTRIAEAMKGADIVLVCVGTPSDPDGGLDLEHVRRAVREVGAVIRTSGRFNHIMRSTMLAGVERRSNIGRRAAARRARTSAFVQPVPARRLRGRTPSARTP
jgi:GDP-mannose 6-dehydrogenase